MRQAWEVWYRFWQVWDRYGTRVGKCAQRRPRSGGSTIYGGVNLCAWAGDWVCVAGVGKRHLPLLYGGALQPWQSRDGFPEEGTGLGSKVQECP